MQKPICSFRVKTLFLFFVFFATRTVTIPRDVALIHTCACRLLQMCSQFVRLMIISCALLSPVHDPSGFRPHHPTSPHTPPSTRRPVCPRKATHSSIIDNWLGQVRWRGNLRGVRCGCTARAGLGGSGEGSRVGELNCGWGGRAARSQFRGAFPHWRSRRVIPLAVCARVCVCVHMLVFKHWRQESTERHLGKPADIYTSDHRTALLVCVIGMRCFWLCRVQTVQMCVGEDRSQSKEQSFQF